MEYFGLFKLLENDIIQLIMTIDPEDVKKYEEVERTMDHKIIQNKNKLITEEIRDLKNLITLRRMGEKTSMAELRNFLLRIIAVIENRKELKQEHEIIRNIYENTMTNQYFRVLDSIIKTMEIIQQKLELQGIEISKVLVIEEDRLEKMTSLPRLEHLNAEEYQSLIKSINKHKDRFHLKGEKLPATNLLKHRIKTKNDDPIFVKQYRLPPCHKNEVKKQVEEYLEDGIIKPSISPYSNPVFIVPKKPDSQGNPRYRMVLDFRKLNEVTEGDSYL